MEDYVVQHITVENFKHQSSAAVYNILKELVIKKDIAIGKITLVDWSQYGYKADWLFGVVVDGTYYFMTIHPDGSFKIEALKRNLFTMTEYDKYMDYFGLNEENKNDYRGVIGLVKDAEGNINLIKDTNMYSMPDYTAMGDVLKNVASEGRFPGKDVVTWLRLVMDTTDKIKVHAELDIVIPHIDVNAEYTKANVMGLFKGITTKKEVVRYVFENTGIMLYEKIEQVTDSTMVVGVDIGSQIHYARAFDNRGRELTKRIFSFHNDLEGFNSFNLWAETLKTENKKTAVLIGCEPTGHYWFAFAKYVNDHQKRLVMVNPFSVKKIKELDDNSPKKTDSKDPKTIAKLVVDGRYSIPYMPEGIYAEIRDLVYSREPIWII